MVLYIKSDEFQFFYLDRIFSWYIYEPKKIKLFQEIDCSVMKGMIVFGSY